MGGWIDRWMDGWKDGWMDDPLTIFQLFRDGSSWVNVSCSWMDDRQMVGCCHNSKNRQTRITVLAFPTFVIFVNIFMKFHEDIFKHFKSKSSKIL